MADFLFLQGCEKNLLLGRDQNLGAAHVGPQDFGDLYGAVRLQVVFQEGNKTMITNLFDKLGKTGKLIRVSDLSMMVEELDGNFIAINKLTEEDRAAAASYMAFIMQEYRRLIPADKQYGISISGITETNTGYKLCPWTSDYNRNEMYEGIVDGLK